MGFWSFVAFAVACVCLLEAYRIYAKSKSVRRSDADLETRVAALEDDNDPEERVRTLEAIVTDPRFRLDNEINKLSN